VDANLAGAAATTATASVAVLGSTDVNAALEQARSADVQALRFQTIQRPSGVSRDQAQEVLITASDASGSFLALDHASKEEAGLRILAVAAQLFPAAGIELFVVDALRVRILEGQQRPGEAPSVTVLR